jgi:phospholipase/carboxylesterase
MNRFHLKALPGAAVTRQPLHIEHSLLRTARSQGLHYSLFAPLHYEQNYAYPLVIWLHGPGDNERQLQRVMPLVSMRNYVSIGPRAPHRVEGGEFGYQWTQSDSDVFTAEQCVFECVNLVAERFNIAAGRIFLAGYQCGGTMAFRLGLKHPQRFAGVLSLGGPFPSGNTPLAFLEDARRLPLFITQGRYSTMYPVETTCQELRLFHSAGMHVTFRQYPCGDDLLPQMLHDMNVWIMDRVTGVDSSEAQDLFPRHHDDA